MLRKLSRRFLPLALLPLALLPGQDNEAVFRSGVQLVQVYATVFDNRGRYIDGLAKESFQVQENGKSQELSSFDTPSSGVSCALVLDTTGSMEQFLPRLQNSAARFIDALGDNDSVAIFTFSQRLERKLDFTKDRAAAKRAVLRTRAGGTTALFDALAQAAREISVTEGKKAMVVFTDGADNASALNATAAADRLKKLGIPLYAVAEGEALDSKPLLRVLDEVSRKTGGIAHIAKKSSDVDKIFEQISQEIQHTYLLTYKMPKTQDSAWRTIAVSVLSCNCKVRSREGYFPD